MDRLHALRDTANLPRAVAPPLCPPSTDHSMNDSGLDMRVDDSLTDMQWLQRMDAGSEIPGFVQKVIRKRPRTGKENQHPKTSKDSCRKKLDYGGERAQSNKPPLSYASLIVLAISSTPQRMLTLSGIYRWIESTFPFYRTPESKAWKNSIRHNLSIRKNMFVKVYQFPPRRGNGSYWTLLPDGEEELTKAHPLFTTLLPPIIDEESAYCRIPLTHTVKSRGQYMPVLPQSNRKMPYFALQGSNSSPLMAETQQIEEVNRTKNAPKKLTKQSNKTATTSNTSSHLAEHSYAKIVTFEPELEEVEEELAPEDLVEGSFIPESNSFGCESKRFCRDRDEGSSKCPSNLGQCNLEVGVCDSTTDDVGYSGGGSPRRCVTPRCPEGDDRDEDYSLSSLLGSSFLTPMKEAMNAMSGLDGITFSPLYNFVSPQSDGTPVRPHTHPTPCPNGTSCSTKPSFSSVVMSSKIETAPNSSSTSPGTGFVADFDSGVFSPLPTSLHFSTPLIKEVSPLVDLPRNVFSTPLSNEGHTPLRSVDTHKVPHTASDITPSRKPGSRQLF